MNDRPRLTDRQRVDALLDEVARLLAVIAALEGHGDTNLARLRHLPPEGDV